MTTSSLDASTVSGRLVRAGDLRLHVSEYGEGHPVIWLHGSGPGATGMSNFASNLPAFADYRNLVFDLPRYGASDRPEIAEPLVFHAAARVVAALDGLGVRQTHIVGNSFGGAIGIRIAAERPDLVGRLVVNAGGARVKDGAGPSPGLQILFDYMSAPDPSREGIARFIDAMLADPTLATPELIDQRFAASVRTHPELASIPPDHGDLIPDLPRVRARTLLLWGRDDVFLPLERALLNVRGIPDAELRVIPRCGHWVQVEAREYFNRAVREFFADAPSMAGTSA